MKKKTRIVYYVARTSQLTGNRQYLMSFDVVGKHVEVINVETTRDIGKAYKFVDEEHLAEHIRTRDAVFVYLFIFQRVHLTKTTTKDITRLVMKA